MIVGYDIHTLSLSSSPLMLLWVSRVTFDISTHVSGLLQDTVAVNAGMSKVLHEFLYCTDNSTQNHSFPAYHG